ncbi:sarcosine oxidasee (formaldehyde-forming) [Sarracenia purpurea var. burkii]
MENSGEQFDVIVIGAGIMGSSTTYQIAKRGHKVLLEQFDFLHHCGSSHGESRTIRAMYPENYYSAMSNLYSVDPNRRRFSSGVVFPPNSGFWEINPNSGVSDEGGAKRLEAKSGYFSVRSEGAATVREI